MTFHKGTKYLDGLDFHFFTLNSFTFDRTTKGEDEVLNDFISTSFFLDSYIFDTKEREFLKIHGPFSVQELKSSDFKAFRPRQLNNLMEDLINEDDWGDDLDTFKKLWTKSNQRIESLKLQNGTLFHLNKNWFSESDNQTWDKQRQYTYFVTFVYVSTVEQRIITFDFGFD